MKVFSKLFEVLPSESAIACLELQPCICGEPLLTRFELGDQGISP
jgi:hypothetical protein